MRKLKLTGSLILFLTLMSMSFYSNAECKVEIFDCPGLGTGDRQICHENGNGVECTNCGESTTCGSGGNEGGGLGG